MTALSEEMRNQIRALFPNYPNKQAVVLPALVVNYLGQGALVPDSGWAWQGDGPPVAEGKSERLLGSGHYRRLAVTWYRSGSMLTGSNMHLKLANIADRLILRERPTMVLILSAEDRPGQPAERRIAAFRDAIGPTGPWMDRLAAGR